MSDNHGATCTRDTLLQNIAAELTSAVHALVLRHGMRGSWLDLELGLWRTLAETVEHRARQTPRPGSADELDVWRERFLEELTEEAFHVAVRHVVQGSLQEIGRDLCQAFRSVIERDRGRRYDATPEVPDRNVPRRGRGTMRVRAETLGGRDGDSCQRHRVHGRDDILAVVAKEFAEWGYHGTDMGLVAEALQSGKGTLYRYFHSKEEPFLAAVDLGLRRLREAVDASTAEAPGPREQVSQAISSCLTFFDANPEFAKLLIQGCAEFRDRMRRTWLTHRDAALGPWQELYCGPTAQDRVRPMPAKRSLNVVGALVCGAVFGRGLTESGRGPESWVQDVLDVVFNGILNDEAPAAAGCGVPSAMPASAASKGPLPR
jgi:AcrR family transcriptional regulator